MSRDTVLKKGGGHELATAAWILLDILVVLIHRDVIECGSSNIGSNGTDEMYTRMPILGTYKSIFL